LNFLYKFISSLKAFNEAKDLAKSLTKKQFIEENEHIKIFFHNFENQIKSKIKILDQLNFIKKSINQDYDVSKKNEMDLSNISKINHTAIPQKPLTIQQLEKNDGININSSDSKEESTKIIVELVKNCENILEEIEEDKKSLNKSLFLDATVINQNSFYIPQGEMIKNELQINTASNNLKNSGVTHNDTNFLTLMEKLEEKFAAICVKLKKIKMFFEKENVLKAKRESKQQRLEKLKKSYSTLKKVYENAIRSGIKLHK
jgi:hypothetical protein